MGELGKDAEDGGVGEVSPLRIFVHNADKVLYSHLDGSIFNICEAKTHFL